MPRYDFIYRPRKLPQLLGNCLVLVALVVSLLLSPIHAQSETGPITTANAAEEGRDSLRSSYDYPWYDAANDTTRGLALPPDQTKAPPPPPPPTQVTYGTSTSSGDFQYLWWFLLVVVVLIILWLIIRTMQQRDPEWQAAKARPQPGTLTSVARLTDLPVELSPRITNMQDEARRLSGIGNYGLAIVYLYSHMLVRLTEARRIQLAKGKTNRQYLRELRSDPELWKFFSRAIGQFEGSYFGDHPPSPAMFDALLHDWQPWEIELSRASGFVPTEVKL
jgi:hypothetical protein